MGLGLVRRSNRAMMMAGVRDRLAFLPAVLSGQHRANDMAARVLGRRFIESAAISPLTTPLPPPPGKISDRVPAVAPNPAVSPLNKPAPAPPPPRPASLNLVPNVSPLVDLHELTVDECRPFNLQILPTDRILVLGPNREVKEKVIEIVLTEDPVETRASISGYITRSNRANVLRVEPSPVTMTLRESAGRLVGRKPTDQEFDALLEKLEIAEWFDFVRSRYPKVSLDADFGALPENAPGNATLLRAWAPLMFKYAEGGFKEAPPFHVFFKGSFAGMIEEEIMTTLGLLPENVGYLRVASTDPAEVLEDGIVHSARCGRGSRRKDEQIWTFWRDRVILTPVLYGHSYEVD
ncbi:hypothetical protein DFJ74DRAFT_314118 [Hyaloraphidium curvatum]|nr:hypothetical protein DFJ74DRAFT_314118 [Hyaloraphidium curvatum]